MTLLRQTSLAGLAMVLAGCSGAAILNGITPSGSYDRDKNVRYGDGSRQVMDIYRSERDVTRKPVIVFVHGGGWNAGNKSMYKFVAEGFAKDGFDVVVPNYRLWPDMTYPDMVVDTGAAVRDTAQRFPGRPLVLIGHSAGAYNVLQTAVAPDVSGVDVCNTVAGVIALAAPTGVYRLTDEPYISIFPEYRLTGPDGPANRTPDKTPPLLLINGTKDETVRAANATTMAERYQALGLPAEAIIYDGMSHIDPVKNLSRHFDGNSTLKSDILAFIDNLNDGADFCGT